MSRLSQKELLCESVWNKATLVHVEATTPPQPSPTGVAPQKKEGMFKRGLRGLVRTADVLTPELTKPFKDVADMGMKIAGSEGNSDSWIYGKDAKNVDAIKGKEMDKSWGSPVGSKLGSNISFANQPYTFDKRYPLMLDRKSGNSIAYVYDQMKAYHTATIAPTGAVMSVVPINQQQQAAAATP